MEQKTKKEVVGIYCGILNIPNWDESSTERGLGGSETWAVEISKALQGLGYQVMLFAQPDKDYTAPSGVQYFRADRIEEICKTQEFDYFITSRMLQGLEYDIKCKNNYLMTHDLDIMPTSKLKTFLKIKKTAILSEYQGKLYKSKYNLTDIFKTANGINPELYQNIDHSKKKNMMVWSSCPDRCLTYFINEVFPLIKKEIPDFTLKVCSYVEIDSEYPKVEGVEYIGPLSKKDLANLQKEAKVWAYPNLGYLEYPNGSIKAQVFHETFCITAVENAWAGNAIITFNQGALPETLKDYSEILKIHVFDESGLIRPENKKIAAELLAIRTATLLKNEKIRLDLCESLKEITKGYTWENIALEWKKEFESNFEKEIKIPTLSVCLIVKNEEKKIRRCLESLVPFADEICVADTGSTDSTVEICKSIPKVKVKQIDWRNDFAWARNISFSMATSDYIMWVDADDYINPKSQEFINNLKTTGELSYVDIVYFPYVYKNQDTDEDYFDFLRDRIYRASLKPVWYGRIHEYILTRSDKNPINQFLKRTDAEVQHYHDSPGNRNLNIFIDMEKVGELSSGRDWYYYGKEWWEAGRYESANYCFQKSLDSNNVFGSDKTNALQLMSKAYKSLGNQEESFQRAVMALGTTSTPRADVCCLLGDAYLFRGKNHWAEVFYREAIDNRLEGLEDTFTERTYYTWYPRLQYGNLLFDRGEYKEAKKYLLEAKEMNPSLDIAALKDIEEKEKEQEK